jgi:epoxide hydrolase-like predicted phosphatase
LTIRAVIFDFGGVLLRTEDPNPRQQLAARLGKPKEQLYHAIFDSESARQATLGKISAEAHWEVVRQALGIGEEAYQEVRDEFWAGDRLDIELIGYLRGLKLAYKTALLSNAWDDLRAVIQRNWEITDVFDEMIISAEVGIAKPDARIYRIAVERLGVVPQEAVFVDDFIDNIESASAFGLQTIHFQGRQPLYNELARILDSKASDCDAALSFKPPGADPG